MNQESPQIKAIKARYKVSLSEKADMLANHLDILDNDSQRHSRQFNDLSEDLHKLAGSSGMYGYEDIALLARSVMTMIEQNQHAQALDGVRELRDLLLRHA